MHLSRDEILEAVCENRSYEVFLLYEKWLDPKAYREPWREETDPAWSEQRGSFHGPKPVPETFGAVYPEIRLHSDGSSCDITQGEINRLYFTWKESVVEESSGRDTGPDGPESRGLARRD